MSQSQKYDGREALRHHEHCFFLKFKPQSRDEIHNFEGLKYDDQLNILMKIDPSSIPTLKKVAEKLAAEKSPNPNDIVTFGIEYSTANDQRCVACNENISRNEIRIKKIVYDSDIAVQFGKEIRWHHLHCFIEKRDSCGFVVGGYQLPGFQSLQTEHQKIVREALP